MKLKSTILISLVLIFFTGNTNAQKTSINGANTITSGVPFLDICPDARGTSLGWTGAATSPDIFSQSQNPAKYAFFRPKKNILSEWNYRFLYRQDTCAQDSIFRIFINSIIENANQPNFECIDSTSISDNFSLALSYTPWLRNLVSDINLAYLVGYKRLDDQQTISVSLRYITLGNIQFMSEYGAQLGAQKPNEFAIDLGYSRLLSENYSGAVAIRYIRSDITGGQMVNGKATHTGNTYAADVAFYYQNQIRKNRKNSTIAAGINISNIGAKISYTDGETKDFIPTNMKLGIAYSTEIDSQNSFTITLDANKLLVPTPTENQKDNITGFSSNKSVVAGIFSSFSDAPGGFSEELKEIRLSGGIEYAYQQNYFLRAGYFHENENKGNRKFFSIGFGANITLGKYLLTINAAKIKSIYQNAPIDNTKQLSISFTI